MATEVKSVVAANQVGTRQVVEAVAGQTVEENLCRFVWGLPSASFGKCSLVLNDVVVGCILLCGDVRWVICEVGDD